MSIAMSYKIDSEDDRKNFEAFVTKILELKECFKIKQTLSELEFPPPYLLRMKIIYSTKEPFGMFKSLSGGRLSLLGEESRGFSLGGEYGKKYPRKISTSFVVFATEYPNVGVILTISICSLKSKYTWVH